MSGLVFVRRLHADLMVSVLWGEDVGLAVRLIDGLSVT